MHQKICHSVEKTEDDFRISMKKQSNNKTMQIFVLNIFVLILFFRIFNSQGNNSLRTG